MAPGYYKFCLRQEGAVKKSIWQINFSTIIFMVYVFNVRNSGLLKYICAQH